MSVDDLYFLVKSIYKDVIATKEEPIVLLATDTVMGLFHDLFVTTHFILLTGRLAGEKELTLLHSNFWAIVSYGQTIWQVLTFWIFYGQLNAAKLALRKMN
jgi:hypothetical protein